MSLSGLKVVDRVNFADRYKERGYTDQHILGPYYKRPVGFTQCRSILKGIDPCDLQMLLRRCTLSETPKAILNI